MRLQDRRLIGDVAAKKAPPNRTVEVQAVGCERGAVTMLHLGKMFLKSARGFRDNRDVPLAHAGCAFKPRDIDNCRG